MASDDNVGLKCRRRPSTPITGSATPPGAAAHCEQYWYWHRHPLAQRVNVVCHAPRRHAACCCQRMETLPAGRTRARGCERQLFREPDASSWSLAPLGFRRPVRQLHDARGSLLGTTCREQRGGSWAVGRKRLLEWQRLVAPRSAGPPGSSAGGRRARKPAARHTPSTSDRSAFRGRSAGGHPPLCV